MNKKRKLLLILLAAALLYGGFWVYSRRGNVELGDVVIPNGGDKADIFSIEGAFGRLEGDKVYFRTALIVKNDKGENVIEYREKIASISSSTEMIKIFANKTGEWQRIKVDNTALIKPTKIVAYSRENVWLFKTFEATKIEILPAM